MSKTKEELRAETLYRKALHFARRQLTSGIIDEEDVEAMIGERRTLYMNAIYSLDIEPFGSPYYDDV